MLDALQELRGQFRENSKRRVAEMFAQLIALEHDFSDRDALYGLARHFHGLAGLGGTYGYPRISELADEGEAGTMPLVKQSGTPDAEQLRRWRRLVVAISEELLQEKATRDPVGRDDERATAFDVIIVEDDPDLAEYLARLCAAEGMRARTCGSRAAAIAAIDASPPDAAVVDVILPDGEGYDVVEEFRRRGSVGGAVMISVRHGFADKMRAIQSGADAWFDKPLDPDALLRRLAAFRTRKYRKPERVLLVEDEPEQRDVIEMFLTSAGYQVTVCNDVSAFEQSLRECSPDVVLLDVNLGGDANGFDLARFIRHDDRYAMLPIIFVTTQGEVQSVIRGTRAGGDDYILKPVDPALLLSSIASRLERAKALRDVMERDPLTGVLTRASFEARLRTRLPAPAVLAMLDLDEFKKVNDIHGHLTGDRVLAAFGTTLRRATRQSDLVGRYGGEEFVLLIENSDVLAATRLIERLLDEFTAVEHHANGTTFSVTFSAGLAPLGADYESALAQADEALYRAKEGGRRRVQGS